MRRRLLALSLTLLATLLAPATTLADCQPAASVREALAAAEVAFVGTVIAAAEGQPGAGFQVEEVWVGTIGETIDVHGMASLCGRPQLEPQGLMEDDRLWREGARYLVIPYLDEGLLRDNICTATTEWRAELAALRPPTATVVQPAAPTAAPPPWPVLVAGSLALVLLFVGWLAFRRTSSH